MSWLIVSEVNLTWAVRELLQEMSRRESGAEESDGAKNRCEGIQCYLFAKVKDV